MPPKRGSKQQRAQDDSSDEGEYMLAPERAGGSEETIQADKGMDAVMKMGQQRQTTKRRNAEKEHAELISRVRDELTALDAEHAMALAALRREQLEALQGPFRNKLKVEERIMQSLQVLQAAHKSTSKEVRCALDGRVSDLT